MMRFSLSSQLKASSSNTYERKDEHGVNAVLKLICICKRLNCHFKTKMCHTVYLVVRRQLHGRHAVDMLFDLVEEVVPASNQTALVLVVHQVELIRVPYFTDLKTKTRLNIKKVYKSESCLFKWTEVEFISVITTTLFRPLPLYLFEELLQSHFSLGYQENVLHHHLILLQIHIPDLSQGQLREDPVHMQTLHQLLPVAVLQSL